MYEKLKSFASHDGLYTTIVLLLVGVVSFGLGRQSVLSNDFSHQTPAGIIFNEAPLRENTAALRTTPTTPAVVSSETTNSTSVVGSRSGTKYHRLDCPGAKQIKEENKLFFATTELARAAGYTPAANCPDLQ